VTTLNVNTITPAGSTLTLGASGDTIVATDDIKVNTVKDAGGNTLWVSNGSGVLSSVKAGIGGADKLLSTQTVTNQASVSFTSGIDSTYKEYVFRFINVNPATDFAGFQFQVNAVDATGYNEFMTTTYFTAFHYKSDANSGVDYDTGRDQAQGTSYQLLAHSAANFTKASLVGEFHLFNPASTTYVKHWTSMTQELNGSTISAQTFAAGYINITLAIDDIQFKMSSGNFDGIIKMYGIAT